MKKFFYVAAVITIATINCIRAEGYNAFWQKLDEMHVPSRGERVLQPIKASVYWLNDAAMKSALFALPSTANDAQIFELPTPDGSFKTFRVWQTSIMAPELAAKYPGIKTFTAVALDNHLVTAKLDFSPRGFHAMIYDGYNTYFVDPYSNLNDGYYQCYYKHDYIRKAGTYMHCDVHDDDVNAMGTTAMLTDDGLPNLQYKINGDTKKKYRLALACTGEYAIAVAGAGPTKAAVLAAMVVSVNRVTGVYERELAVTMQLIANEDTLIFLDGNTDPYTNNNGGTMLNQNQTTVTSRIGSANYDIGHVFSTGGGGIANLGCVCSSNSKAMGVTGSTSPIGDSYDIDYVAHEMGHQFGGDHTFNSNLGSCGGGNRANASAYEVGSGTTIMAYAGICGSDNTQQHSDAYFHARSLQQITDYITTGNGHNCPVTSSSGNTPATFSPFSASYNIPYKTPFELTAPSVTDANHDTLNYCWEEWDRGDYGKSLAATKQFGPIFRSYLPDTSGTRIFPRLSKLLNNTSDNGEKLPDTDRVLRFKVTVRDIYNGIGCFNFSDDSIVLNVINTTTPFTVTNPSTAAVSWTGGTNQTVTWNISSTDIAPISCSTVDIYFSIDGGYTWPYLLKSQAPNTGSASVIVPNAVNSAMARVKVKGHGNVFFNISNQNFSFTHNNALPWPTGVSTSSNDVATVKVFPVPASNVLHISSDLNKMLQASIYNDMGQIVWRGTLNENVDVSISSWAKGVYYLRLLNTATGEQSVKSVVIN